VFVQAREHDNSEQRQKQRAKAFIPPEENTPTTKTTKADNSAVDIDKLKKKIKKFNVPVLTYYKLSSFSVVGFWKLKMKNYFCYFIFLHYFLTNNNILELKLFYI